MQTITMKSLPFYIIQNNECFELLDSLLASVESIEDEKTMKEKKALDKCVEFWKLVEAVWALATQL